MDKLKYHLYEDEEGYVIDGRWRGRCVKTVVEHVRTYGGDKLIFDNSDWYPNAMRFLRERLGWMEIDFHYIDEALD